MSIYRASPGVKNKKSGTTWDPTRDRTKREAKEAPKAEKARAKTVKSGAYQVDNYRNTPEE